jgi:EamA domain-containing membrane protein RarD
MYKGVALSVLASITFGVLYFYTFFLKPLDSEQTFAWRMLFGGAILALLELYNINEQDFIEVWQGTREISPPKPEHRARKALR